MKGLSCEEINQLRHDARSVVRELGLLNDAYFEIGVTLAERHLLIELAICQAPTMKEIAERLLIDKSTVSRLISKAVRKGYITCLPGDRDRRKKFLSLTELGKSVLHAFEPIAFTQTKEALLTLSTEEIQVVYQGVSLYAEGLKRARMRNKNKDLEPQMRHVKRESLPEIFEQIHQAGYVLGPFDQKDEQGLYEIFQEVVNSGSQFPYESSSIEEFQQQFFHQNGHVYVCRSSSGEVVGGFYIRANFSGRSSHIANAAYMVRNSHRGKGLGTLLSKASLHLAKDLGFQAMQFNMVLSQNTLAIKLYQRLGFTIAGTIPKAVRNPDGSYQDGYVMYYKLNQLEGKL
jgi:DNA-binding MarR family transcriptional regulator/L-amino acid N-acyltransferase YncA